VISEVLEVLTAFPETGNRQVSLVFLFLD